MVPRGGKARAPLNPNVCCFQAGLVLGGSERQGVSARPGTARAARAAEAAATVAATAAATAAAGAAGTGAADGARKKVLVRSRRSQRSKRPTSAEGWASLKKSRDATARTARPAGWSRQCPPSNGCEAVGDGDVRETRPRSAPPAQAATPSRPASASVEYQGWRDALNEKVHTARPGRPVTAPAARRPSTARPATAPAARRPSTARVRGGSAQGAERLGATPRHYHHCRGSGAFALLEVRKQAVHDASRRRQRQEQKFEAASAAAEQSRRKVEQVAQQARTKEHEKVVQSTDSSVWGAERAAQHEDWDTWSERQPSTKPHPPREPRKGGATWPENRPIGHKEFGTIVSKMKLKTRVMQVDHHAQPVAPFNAAGPRTLPIKKLQIPDFRFQIQKKPDRAWLPDTKVVSEGGMSYWCIHHDLSRSNIQIWDFF